MSHIHLPDGILPVWLWLAGVIIVFLYMFIAGRSFKTDGLNKKIPLIGVFAAFMLIAMSIEIVPLAYHINLAVLTGIVLGPLYSVVSILIVNLILAFLGHGGITTVGLNTITVSVEAIVGYFGFKMFHKKIKNIFVVVFVVSVIALFISCWTSIGIIYLGTGNLQSVEHNHDDESSGMISFGLIENSKHHHEEIESTHHNEKIEAVPEKTHHLHQENRQHLFDIKRFIFLVMVLGSIGWILEGLVTAFIIGYINKMKPDLLEN